MFAAFASDEHGFFSSPDIQLLRIGTIVRPGILLPSKFDIHNTQKCEYNVMSVSIDPKDGYHLIEDFYNKFDTNLTTIGPDKILVFEVNMVKPDYWQMKIRLLLDANHAAALEDLLEIKQLKLRRRTQVITPTLPSECSDTWQRLVYGMKDKRGLSISCPEAYASHDNSLVFCPDPTTEQNCFAAAKLKGPFGVIETLDILGCPRQRVSLPGLQMICAALINTEDYKIFCEDTKSEREMGGNDISGIILSSIAQKFKPFLCD